MTEPEPELLPARCPDCNHLLCKVPKSQGNVVEVWCRKCKSPRTFHGNYPVPQRESGEDPLMRGVEIIPAMG